MVIETGLSDFHKMSVLKTSIKKQPPKVISYRDYKHYSPIRFITEFEGSLYNYVLNAIEKYREHPSIKKIEEQVIKRQSFSVRGYHL